MSNGPNSINQWLQDTIFKPLEDKKMPVMEHLAELQVRLTRAVIITAVVFVATFFYADVLVKWLRIPLQNMFMPRTLSWVPTDLNSDDPIIWRDAYKYEFINQLLGGVEWQDLNFLFVDLPPGTGNESVTTIDLLGHVSGAVIVTTPQEVALLDSRKSVTFCKDSEVPIIGIVENMSGLECPHCHNHIEVFRKGGGEASAMDMGVPFLGRIPLDPDVVIQSDAGEPFAMFNSDTATAECYHEIANKVEAFCKKRGSLVNIGSRQAH